ncbi:hypothetical protein BJL95_11590 [Methylomonas sp. LWB]|nr:hypothetical protein BJL95_11590 [Methylomonas sp. LWB]
MAISAAEQAGLSLAENFPPTPPALSAIRQTGSTLPTMPEPTDGRKRRGSRIPGASAPNGAGRGYCLTYSRYA